jgi:hypothetical protein
MSLLKSFGKFTNPLTPSKGIGNYFTGVNPADQAMQFSRQLPGQVQPYYQPFIDQGQQANQGLNEQYTQMSENPGDYMNQLMKGYSLDNGFQMQKKLLQKELSGIAAAGGYRGNQYDQEKQGQLVAALLANHRGDWLDRVRALQESGLQGRRHAGDLGFAASTGLGDVLGSNTNTMGSIAFQGAQAKQQARSDLLRNIIGGAGLAFGGR